MHIRCVKFAKKKIGYVAKIYFFYDCTYKSKKIAQSHDCWTVTFRYSCTHPWLTYYFMIHG